MARIPAESPIGRRLARAFLLAATVVLLALPAPPSQSAEEETLFFLYRFDRTSWYWTKQESVLVESPECVPGAPCPSEQRKVPGNRQAANTLPVAVENGEYEKISAILFNLFERDVLPGSTISKFVLKISEGQELSEFRSFNAAGRGIQACRIDDFWPTGDAEEWEGQPPFGGKPSPSEPPFAEGACVEGKRDDTVVPAVWTFDLTEVAQPWGEDPFTNSGVMLVGVLGDGGPDETWQINLKFPARDNPDTPNDEYLDSKNTAVVVLAFEQGELPTFAPPSPPLPPPSDGSEVAGFEVPPSPSSVAEPPGPAPAAGGPQPVASPGLPPIEMPGAVWALVPLGLLALAAARSVVLEPVAGSRAEGVIVSIRQRNAERRGVPVAEEEVDPLAAAKRFLGSAKSWLSSLMRRGA